MVETLLVLKDKVFCETQKKRKKKKKEKKLNKQF